MRKFNIEGLCIPSEDYMVNIDDKLKKIIELINLRKYFVINCPRQYGKTTTLLCLEQILKDEYIVASITFEGIGSKSFETEENFCLRFMEFVRNSLFLANISDEYKEAWFNKDVSDFAELSYHITKMCKDQKIVLMIDEVDKTSNNQVFLDFLSMLRSKYLARKSGKDYTFHSVILAGVYDIKNIKFKMIKEGSYSLLDTEEKMYNSPWNIAAEFNIDMSFSSRDIESMLKDYLSENDIPMDTELISQEIYDYTSGYPFLVSNICKIIDEKLNKDWSEETILEAVKITTTNEYTLFDDLVKNFETYKELYDFLYSILILGMHENFNIDKPIIKLGCMLGYMRKENNKVVVSNKIFETRISNYFISKDSSVTQKER
ncbi:MAG: AAA-like domain-containing protein [Oscillospiraceae bacterium]|nr:AAA-like domain-containing protein [Oscillospiraceae bacterium]